MARLIESGKIEEVVFARFEPGEDILKALYDICREKDIRTGIILDGSGSAVDFTYQHFPINPKLCPTNVSIGTMHGKCEISLQGTIGTTVCNLAEGDTPDTVVERMFPTIPGLWEGPVDKWPMVGWRVWTGNSLIVHAHCVASNADYTVCGHLMPGTRVASGDPASSHFTVIIAKISGVELQATIDHKIGFIRILYGLMNDLWEVGYARFI